jgi:anti-sigma-K factor RskA
LRAGAAGRWRQTIAAVAALALAAPVLAQNPSPGAPRKKPAAKQLAHKKASPEQIHRFNELAKKRQETK